MIRLKGEFSTADRRLDAIPAWDPRNRAFPVTALELAPALVSRTWDLEYDRRLDQGREGACVGAGVTHELAAAPMPASGLTMEFARKSIYHVAQQQDPWPGGSYPGASPTYEGTDLGSGLHVAKALGYLDAYHWAFGIDEALTALCRQGPIVIAVPWLTAMFNPRPSGLIDADGDTEGWHCVAVRGLTLKPRLKGETRLGPVVRITQSWGTDHGVQGEVFLRVEDLGMLLGMGGQAAVVAGRRRKRAWL